VTFDSEDGWGDLLFGMYGNVGVEKDEPMLSGSRSVLIRESKNGTVRRIE